MPFAVRTAPQVTIAVTFRKLSLIASRREACTYGKARVMPKTTAPLLSFGASGQIAKTMVYASWKGRAYARRHVIPANPQTTEQTSTRNVFSFLQSVYKLMPALATAPWEAYAKGKVLTARNAFGKSNISTLRAASNLNVFELSPGALGGLPPVSQAITPGSGTLSVAVTVPTVLPQGWTIFSAVTAIIRDQDPHSGILFQVSALEDTTSPYTNAFSALGAHAFQVVSWLKWTRPDGSLAYSPGIQSIGTST